MQAERLRLLVISSDTYPPVRVDVSVLFGEQLSGRGHRIDWLLQSEAACSRPYVAAWGGGKVWVGATDLGNSLFGRVRKHVRGILHDLKVFSLLNSGDYDAVEVKDKFISGLFALLAARLFGKRFIYWLSFPFPEEYLIRAKDGTARYPLLYVIRGFAFKVLLYRILLPAADRVFVQSDQMRRDVAAQGVPFDKMTAVPMGVNPELFPPAPVAGLPRVIPEQTRSFLYLGTLSKTRHLDFLIRVLRQVREQVPGAKLYLVGGGDDASDEELLLTEARRLDLLPAVELVGKLPREQALQYAREADVCVSPIYPNPILNAGSPTKLVEYMALGKAVVANDHPDQRLLIENSGGGLCVPWDESAFANAVAELMSSPQRAHEMGLRGREYALRHRSYSVIADVVESKLLELRVARVGA
jgi:glycosyltransferase involved in cell wall biosynthesis